MFYAGILTKLTELFIAIVTIFTSIYPGAYVKANPMPEMDPQADVRVVSFNLRCTGLGTTSVEYRAPLLSAQLKECDADSMGFQEANLEWLKLLEADLTDYAYVGRTRADGEVLGEASPVFYKKDKYNLLDYGTIWLSKTPDKVGSKDWGSQNIRVCTWALLENKETLQSYVHINTHLDHISQKARLEQMKVLLTKVNEFRENYPVVVTGDFNDYVDSPMYNEAVTVLRDSREIAPVTDNKPTYHNYGTKKELIDFVFVNNKVTPLVYHVIDDQILGAYLSDHFGIYVDLKLG